MQHEDKSVAGQKAGSPPHAKQRVVYTLMRASMLYARITPVTSAEKRQNPSPKDAGNAIRGANDFSQSPFITQSLE